MLNIMTTNMMRNSLTIFMLSAFIYSCQPYGPRAFHVPNLNEKGDLQAAAYVGPMNGFELQADYAWGDRFYSPVDFSWSRLAGNSQTTQRAIAYSMGIGYYTKIKESGRFNLYFSPMYGNFGSANSDYHDSFFSQAIGVDFGNRFKHFESAISFKFENFQYFDSYFNYDGGSPNLASGLTMRFGGEKFKFHMQTGLSYSLVNEGDYTFWTMDMGITYRLNVFKGN